LKKTMTWVVTTAFPIVLSSCGRFTKTIAADISCNIYEISAITADTIAPPKKRTQISGSDYILTRISKPELQLLMADSVNQGLISLLHWSGGYAERYNRQPAMWNYRGAGGGVGVGSMEVRRNKDLGEVKLDILTFHDITSARPLNARLFYEGPAPEEECLLFLKPFSREDGTMRFHVLAFSVTKWREY